MVSIFCGIYLKIHGSGGQKRSAEVMIPFPDEKAHWRCSCRKVKKEDFFEGSWVVAIFP
jgi:hypothetical protein